MGVCYCCATDDVRINVMHWVVITVYGRKGKGMGKEWVTWAGAGDMSTDNKGRLCSPGTRQCVIS